MVTEQTLNVLKGTCIHIWRIDLDGYIGNLSGLLSADEITRAESFKQTQAHDRFIRGRGAIRAILGSYVGIPGKELKFVLQGKGKPSLSFPDSDMEFNLSHCEGMALLAVTNQIPVGIDLERIRVRPSQLKIARRMFPEPVYVELQELPQEQFTTVFFQHWTELEARAKCVGNGIFSHEDGRNRITTRHFCPEDHWIACLATQCIDVSSMELKHFLYRN